MQRCSGAHHRDDGDRYTRGDVGQAGGRVGQLVEEREASVQKGALGGPEDLEMALGPAGPLLKRLPHILGTLSHCQVRLQTEIRVQVRSQEYIRFSILPADVVKTLAAAGTLAARLRDLLQLRGTPARYTFRSDCMEVLIGVFFYCLQTLILPVNV